MMQFMIEGLCTETFDKARALAAVMDLASAIDMTPVGDLLWHDLETGPYFIQVIAESHIIGRYCNMEGSPPYVSIEVLSCKPFQAIKAMRSIVSLFGIYDVRFRKLTHRGSQA